MIEVIGLKRLMILALLILLNTALALLTYLYVVPESDLAKNTLRNMEQQVSRAHAELGRMQVEFEILEKQQGRFDALKKEGYFSRQVRSDAKELFRDVRERSGVFSALANVTPGVTSDDYGVSKVKYKILTSVITVNIEAFDDSDIYRYMDLLQRDFPGDITIDKVSINRTKDVNAAVLRGIASGRNLPLVGASLTASWSTLIPENQVITD